MTTVENTHTPECYPDPKHPGWWYCTGEGHVPNGDPPPKPSDYVDPGNPPVLYWRHKKYPTMLSWAYDLHADGQPYRLDLDSAWQRVKLVPVEPGE